MTRKLDTVTWLFSFFPLKSLVLGHGNKITKLTGLSNVHVALHWDKTQGIILVILVHTGQWTHVRVSRSKI